MEHRVDIRPPILVGPSVVDGQSSSANIANMFATKYSDLGLYT